MSPFFSVIVPVWNGEKYLKECLQSVLKQKFTNIEIVVVDDGSQDESLKIATEMSRKDSRVKVFSKINGGVASARNYGICQAEGEYLIFLDSDDLLGEDALDKAYIELKNKKRDLVICNSYVEMTGTCKKTNILWKNEIVSQVSTNKEIKTLCQNLSSVCIGIYKRQFLINNRIRMNEDITCGEDTDFFFRVLLMAENVSIIECMLFAYRLNETSVSHNLSYKNIRDVMEVCRVRMQDLVKNLSDQIDSEKALSFFATKYIHFSIRITSLSRPEGKELLALMKTDRELLKYAQGIYERVFVTMVKLAGEKLTIAVFKRLIKLRNQFTSRT